MSKLLQLILLLTLCSPLLAAQSPSAVGDNQKAVQSAADLPAVFAGWRRGANQKQTQAEAVDANEAPVLKEYGFTGYERADYTNAAGRKITVQAIHFKDATGAYGAFTYYRQPQMVAEEIGDGGASGDNRILFFKGNLLLQVAMDRVTATTPAEMRELAGSFPVTSREAGQIPDLARYLPSQSLIKQSIRYIVGPVAWERLHAPIPASAVDWSRGAEAIMGTYSSGEGEATMALLYFPTPQIAGTQLRSLEGMHLANTVAPDAMPQLELKRVGPMVAIVGGQISQPEAKSLVASVTYEADVTYNEPTFLGKKDNIGNLIVALITLCGIMVLLMFVIGVFFGGLRVVLQRLFPKRFRSREEDVALITLKLRD